MMNGEQITQEKPRVLIVDDEKANLKILSELLNSEAEVSVAKSGIQGIWKAEKLLPDLILLDIVMPEMDGFETIKKLKQSKSLSEVPVIFITGLDTADNEKYGLDLGALDYIRKPFNASVVKTRIATHLKLIRQTKTLKQLSVKLMDADEAKSRFLANMSHEIRTPLTAIIGYAELIQQNEISGMENGQAVDIIANSGKHLLNLINDILDLSKIEAEKLQIEEMQVVLPLMLDEIFALIKPKVEEKELSFDLEIEYPIPSHIQTDPTRLKQILINLLNNAIKFTDDGSVRLLVTAEEDKIKFNVVDTGIGIGEEQQKRIFSAFEQADVSVTRKFGGTGLGLNISKYLSTRLGGDLKVTSMPGLGSDFEASIGLERGEDSKEITNETDFAQALHSQKSRAQSNVSLSGHILLAEDQRELRMLIVMMLKKLGLEVTAVENGKQLVERALAEEFDLILSDIHMPEMSGQEAIAKLQEAKLDVPTIALTANAMKHELEQYLNKGFTDHLSKPIQRDEFQRKLALYLNEGGVKSSSLDLPDGVKTHLVEQFKQGIPGRIEVLENAFFAKDWNAMKLLSHSFKGAAKSFGFNEMSDLATEIEALSIAIEFDAERANELAAILLSLKELVEQM